MRILSHFSFKAPNKIFKKMPDQVLCSAANTYE